LLNGIATPLFLLSSFFSLSLYKVPDPPPTICDFYTQFQHAKRKKREGTGTGGG
jgi:hypothetical protein